MPPNPVDGIHQAGTDRAARIALAIEQRHIQMEIAAAAFAREDRRRAEGVPSAPEAQRSDVHDEGERRRGGRDGRRRPPDRHDGPDEGHLVDASA